MPRWRADERYEFFVRQHGAELLRFAAMLTGNRADAEDVVQEALISVAGTWPRVRLKTAKAYARTTIARKVIDRARREDAASRGSPPDRASSDRALLKFEEDQNFFGMLDALPAKQRAVLVLRYYADLDDATIAEILRCSASTVRSQAHRGLNKLRTRANSSNVEG